MCCELIAVTECDAASVSHHCLQYARDFYTGQWLRDNQVELERALQGPALHSTSLQSDPLLMDDEEERDTELNSSAQAMHQAEKNKDFLLSLLKPMPASDVG